MTTNPYQPGRRIVTTAGIHPTQPALLIDDDSWSYAELLAAAGQIRGQFPSLSPDAPQPVTAVMAGRHVSSYAGILAARLAGHAYVPLNVNHPCARNAAILRKSGAQRVICGAHATRVWRDILKAGNNSADDVAVIDCGDSKRDYTLQPAEPAWGESPRVSSPEDLAYILFTSGSTGEPKGVPIRNSELEAYLAAAVPLVEPQPGDRFSQTFDLTFDLSVHDLFVCWENAATLVVPSEKELRMPSAYIRERGITCWFSVPTLAYQMRLQEDLNAGAFPGLRHSLFCGEALPTLLAREWAQAAPASVVENWYGPTEATIACARYRLTEADIPGDTVPIGKAFPRMELLLDNGELLLAGPQLASGYLHDAEKTAASFVTLPDGRRAYRTGDRAAFDEDGNAHFLGRVDNQVKVRGYRIELGEIESALRQASGGLNSVALAWPGGDAIASTVVAALETTEADTTHIKQQLTGKLPEYMLPSMIFCVPSFPRNASGKLDRGALAETLQQQADDTNHGGRRLAPEATILLAAIKAHAPLLETRTIMSADNLFAAGMDSLAFVSVTTDIERSLGLSLDQETVILLAEMSFDEIVAEAQGKTKRLARPIDDGDEALPLLDRIRRMLGIPRVITKPRANRALQFIERFPDYLAQQGAPDILAVGSSGTFRAVCPGEFGDDKVVLNAGFPAVNAAGLHMLCEFIRRSCEAARIRIPLIIYELDPMHISTTPPSGDINLGADYFNGNVVPLRGANTSLEFQWRAETKGAWTPTDKVRQKDRKPNWVRKRDRVIAASYLGEIDFEPSAVEHWFAGARTLQAISDRMVCFVHPADRTMTDEIQGECGSDKLERFIDTVSRELGLQVLPWQQFELQPGDFLDVNHMNARGGREKLSRQLAAMVSENVGA